MSVPEIPPALADLADLVRHMADRPGGTLAMAAIVLALALLVRAAMRRPS